MKGLLFFLFCPNLILAQITITDADLPVSSNVYYYSNVIDLLSVDVNQTGGNYNWDFSTLNYFDQDSLEVVSVSSTPIAYQFFFNNLFLYPDHYATSAQSTQDVTLMSTVTISDRYDYYKASSTSYDLVGFGANVNGVPTSVKYDTIDQVYPLPLNYGTVDSTSAYYLTSIPTLGTYGQWIRRKVEVDGWGILTTPFSSYDVLRVKTTLYQRDTIFIDQLMLGDAFDRPISNIYEWYANGQGAPVLIVTSQSGAVTEIKYKDDLHLSAIEHDLSGLEVFPNPVVDDLNFSSDMSEVVFIEIFNVNGVKVSEMRYKNKISLGFLKSGWYLLKLNYTNRYELVKFLKN